MDDAGEGTSLLAGVVAYCGGTQNAPKSEKDLGARFAVSAGCLRRRAVPLARSR